MGLSISYWFDYEGGGRRLKRILERARTRCCDELGVEASRPQEVAPVFSPYRDCDGFQAGEHRRGTGRADWLSFCIGLGMVTCEWQRLEGQGVAPHELPARLGEYAGNVGRTAHGLGLCVHVDEGAEPVVVALGTLDDLHWCGGHCTETQHAKGFVDAHIAVARVLDICGEEGLSVGVDDEGGYWETRDLSVLAENAEQYASVLEELTGAMKCGRVNGSDDLSRVASVVSADARYVIELEDEDGPCDDRQKNYLHKLGIEFGPGITFGQASKLIDEAFEREG